MRTTLAIDDDVLMAARELAETQRKSVGSVISSLARKALNPDRPTDVSVLIALADPLHLEHPRAHARLGQAGQPGMGNMPEH